jgi:hypothetical protein
MKKPKLVVAVLTVLSLGVALPLALAATYTVPANNQTAIPTFQIDPTNGTAPGGMLPGKVTLVPLDVSTVTTGGTAVNALAANHRTRGGWLYNPATATIPLCINEVGAASGTTSQGSLTCIPSDRTYSLAPSANAVSVISSDSAHPFSGYGYN